MRKLLFIVLDGVGDIRSRKFGNTPLENNRLKSLNYLAEIGVTGMIEVTPGIAPESNSAVLTLLGYPTKLHGGRGPLEAIGLGMNFKNGMLGLRCNFATSSDGKKLVDRRAGRDLTDKETKKLEQAINKNVRLSKGSFMFKSSVAHRGVLIIKHNKRLSKDITNTDPAYRMKDGVAEALRDYKMEIPESKPLSKKAELSAELLNEFTKKSFEVLDKHPVNKVRQSKGKLKGNIILSRDPGNEVPKLYNISKKSGLKWAILADMPLEIGIGKLAGMHPVNLPLPKFTKKDFPARVEKTLNALKNYGALYIHIKGPDLFGHDGNFRGKKKAIEEIDRYYFKPLLESINLKEHVIAVTGDHSTPCCLNAHSADPVPILIAGGNIEADNVRKFNETDCKNGSLGKLKGVDVMKTIMKKIHLLCK